MAEGGSNVTNSMVFSNTAPPPGIEEIGRNYFQGEQMKFVPVMKRV